jgi:hypothetical protein
MPAAVHIQELSGDKTSIRRSQEDRRSRNIIHMTWTCGW